MRKMLNLKALKKMNLLYVEDNKDTIDPAYSVFSTIFNNVFLAKDGNEGFELFLKNDIDLIISDISMPSLNGLDMCKRIREKSKKVSIIFLTAFSDKEYLLEASNLQIDGYLIKPINFTKLEKVFNNIVDRYEIQTSITFYNGVQYFLEKKELKIDDAVVTLGQKENLFINYLANNLNKLVPKNEIADNVWKNDYMTEGSLKNIVYHLRKKIGKDCIINITGIGYKLNLKE